MKNKVNRLVKYLVPAAITLAICVLVMLIKGIWPLGQNRIDYFDNMQQVAPLYTHLWDWMHGEASLWFDWYTGLGTNVSMSISAFSMLSPFNIILYFVPRELILESISILTVVKMIFMSVAMYAYLNRKYTNLVEGVKTLLAVMYAFCGYTLLYGSCFTPWMDIVALFPLLMMAYDYMMETGKKVQYIVMIALIFIVNYYLSAMAVLYILIISGAYIFIKCEKEKRREKVFNLGIGTVTGIALSAFVLVPVIVQLSQSQRGSASTSLVSQYCSWITSSIVGKGTLSDFQRWTMFYGIAFVVAIIIMGICKYKGDKKELKYNIFSITVVLAPALIEAVNIIWHFGSYNGYTLRNGFLISFTLLSVAGYYGQHIFTKKKCSKMCLLVQSIIAVVYATAFIIIHNAFPSIWESAATILVFVELAFMTLVYVLVFVKTKDKFNYNKVIILVAAEVFVGAFALLGPPKCYTYYPFQYGDYVQEANKVMDAFEIEQSVTDRITNPDVSLNANYPLIIRRGALSSFTAALQDGTQASAFKMGYSKFFLWTLDSGGTVFTESLFHVTNAVNSNALDENLYTLKNTYEGYKYYDSKYVLPFVNVVNSSLADAQFGHDWIENHNILYKAISKDSENLVTKMEYDSYVVNETAKGFVAEYKISVNGNKAVYMSVSDIANEDRDFNVSSLYRSMKLYINNKSVVVADIGDLDNTEYMHDYNNNIVYLGCFKDEVIDIRISWDLSSFEKAEDRKRVFEYAQVCVGALDMDKMDQLVSAHKNDYCETGYTNDSLTIKVKGTKNNNMALVPVIFSDNWDITVNGNKVEGKAVQGLFTGIEIGEGDNEIVMQFVPKGKNIGFIITAVTLFITIILLVINAWKKIVIPDWMLKVVFGVYALVYAVLMIIMFIIPGIMWLPVYIIDLIRSI